MENTQHYQVEEDLRQSSGWGKYLNSLGWSITETSKGNQLFIKKIFLLGSVCKLQRPKSMDEKELDEVDKIAKENNIKFIKLEPLFNQDLDLLKNSGYETSQKPLLPPSAVIVELKKDKNTLKEELHKNAKYSIGAANKNNVEIEIICNPNKEGINKFYEISKASTKRNHIYPLRQGWLENMVSCFENKSYLIFAKINNEYVASNLYLAHTNTVWHMFAGINKLGREKDAGYKLLWESILNFKDLGYEYLDLGGVVDNRFPKHTKNWGGFSYFKKKFSKNIVKYPKPYVKILSPMLTLFKPFL